MFNAKDLLGTIMDSGLSGSSRGRMDHALGSGGLGGQGGGLDQLLSSLGGGTGGNTAGGFGGLADGAKSLLGGAQRSLRDGNPVAVGGLGALAGALFGGGGDSFKGALGGTALALLGSMALQAMQGSRDERSSATAANVPPPAPLGVRPPSNRAEEQALEDQALLVLRAMINAAKADGHVDQSELQRIVGKLQESGADAEAQAYVRDAFNRPMETNSIVQDAGSDPILAAEVYAGSVLAIEVDTPEERQYLAQLASGLRLHDAVVQRIHATLGVAA